ncbi:MAG: hypothetical protein QM569_04110 [Acidovorax sp.]|uniref:hypothetical protein n=1 Tax=Acidovorax sp. TaxID=1872122 RepID=UPI0039E2EA21
MSPEEKRELQYRARRAIAAPVPDRIRNGSARAADDYKRCAQVVSAYLRSGNQADRARLHVLRLESMQGLLP